MRRGVPWRFSASLLWLFPNCTPWLYASYIALLHFLAFYSLTILLTSQLPWEKCSKKNSVQTPLKWLNCYKAKACPGAGWSTSWSKNNYWRSPDVQKAFISRQSHLCPVWAVSKLSQSAAHQTQQQTTMRLDGKGTVLWRIWQGAEAPASPNFRALSSEVVTGGCLASHREKIGTCNSKYL